MEYVHNAPGHMVDASDMYMAYSPCNIIIMLVLCDLIIPREVCCFVVEKSVYLLLVDYSELWEYFFVRW